MVRVMQSSNSIFSVVHLMYNSCSRLKSLALDTLPLAKIFYIPKVHFSEGPLHLQCIEFTKQFQN